MWRSEGREAGGRVQGEDDLALSAALTAPALHVQDITEAVDHKDDDDDALCEWLGVNPDPANLKPQEDKDLASGRNRGRGEKARKKRLGAMRKRLQAAVARRNSTLEVERQRMRSAATRNASSSTALDTQQLHTDAGPQTGLTDSFLRVPDGGRFAVGNEDGELRGKTWHARVDAPTEEQRRLLHAIDLMQSKRVAMLPIAPSVTTPSAIECYVVMHSRTSARQMSLRFLPAAWELREFDETEWSRIILRCEDTGGTWHDDSPITRRKACRRLQVDICLSYICVPYQVDPPWLHRVSIGVPGMPPWNCVLPGCSEHGSTLLWHCQSEEQEERVRWDEPNLDVDVANLCLELLDSGSHGSQQFPFGESMLRLEHILERAVTAGENVLFRIFKPEQEPGCTHTKIERMQENLALREDVAAGRLEELSLEEWMPIAEAANGIEQWENEPHDRRVLAGFYVATRPHMLGARSLWQDLETLRTIEFGRMGGGYDSVFQRWDGGRGPGVSWAPGLGWRRLACANDLLRAINNAQSLLEVGKLDWDDNPRAKGTQAAKEMLCTHAPMLLQALSRCQSRLATADPLCGFHLFRAERRRTCPVFDFFDAVDGFCDNRYWDSRTSQYTDGVNVSAMFLRDEFPDSHQPLPFAESLGEARAAILTIYNRFILDESNSIEQRLRAAWDGLTGCERARYTAAVEASIRSLLEICGQPPQIPSMDPAPSPPPPLPDERSVRLRLRGVTQPPPSHQRAHASDAIA